MKVIDTDTGEVFVLYPTDELREELAAFHRSECSHPQTEIRRFTVAGGAIQTRRQCMKCGATAGNAISKAEAPADALPKDEKLQGVYRQARDAERQAIVQRHVRKQRTNDELWWAQYSEYLKSPEWATKRKKVLDRANGICEGCREKHATQAHHLTYQNVGQEFLFELVAVCNECHERLHRERSDSDGSELAGEVDWSDAHPCADCRWQDEQDDKPWCSKFDIAVRESMSKDGPCGPKRSELEGLK